MRLIGTLTFILLITVTGFAQKDHLASCGSHSFRSDWLKRYQAQPEKFDTRSDQILYVPMTIHFVGNDNGSGLFLETSLANALCTLNEDFLDSDIQFYIKGEIRQIWNSAYADHATTLKGGEMMFEYNVAGTLNNYVVGNPAGNCGYNLPYAGIALSDNCMGANDHTWAHEIGHALSIPHPFLGWEGGVSYDGSVPHNFDNPAPEYVVYDYTFFKDTLILDTLIIDTAYVELLDGSNCDIAADGFCDTKADYLASRWPCDSNGQSITEQTDPTGAKFYSDASLIMSYALDNCAVRFSDDQIAAMRANLVDEKPDLLIDQSHPGDLSQEITTINTPFQDELVYYLGTEFEWDAVGNAENYLFQLNLGQNGTFVAFDSLVVGTQLILPELDINKTYYARVKAFGKTDFCADWSSDVKFKTSDVSAVDDQDFRSVCKISPTLLQQGDRIYLLFEKETPLFINIVDLQGRKIKTEMINNNDEVQLMSDNMSPGVYIIQVVLEDRAVSTKIIVGQ